jgi:hypothetical protein
VDEVLLEAFEEASRIAGGEADTVVRARIVDQAVEAAVLLTG